MNVVFLDIDGVVNTPMWRTDLPKGHIPVPADCSYALPPDPVNNYQACMWVSEFCRKFDYKIVVSSTWRFDGLGVCTTSLYRGGIGKDIDIIGSTPILHETRGKEIKAYLNCHNDVKNFLIFDDDSDMEDLKYRLVQCKSSAGFLQDEFNQARTLHHAFYRD